MEKHAPLSHFIKRNKPRSLKIVFFLFKKIIPLYKFINPKSKPMKKILLIVLGLCLNVSLAQNSNRSIKVDNTQELLTAINKVNNNEIDTVILTSSEYNFLSSTNLSINRSGTNSTPIIIKTSNDSDWALLKGEISLALKGSFIKISHLKFGKLKRSLNTPYIEITGNNNDILKCKFEYDDSYDALAPNIDVSNPTYKASHVSILLAGQQGTVKNCRFENKKSEGSYINIGKSDTPSSILNSQNLIEHNFFSRPKRKGNGGSAIRVGHGSLRNVNAYNLIQYNLFQECMGEPEIISIKSSKNLIRYNTFRNNFGFLSLRQGSNNYVVANYFFGNRTQALQGGIRVRGNYHYITSNYLEDLRPRPKDSYVAAGKDVYNAAIDLKGGTNYQGATPYPWQHAEAATSISIFNNTIYNSVGIGVSLGSDMHTGTGRKYVSVRPKNIFLKNNLLINNSDNQSLDTLFHTNYNSQGSLWVKNKYLGNNLGNVNPTQINSTNSRGLNPVNLKKYKTVHRNGVHTPKKRSKSIIDKGKRAFLNNFLFRGNALNLNVDVQGKPRKIGKKTDIGAIEYGNSTILNYPLYDNIDDTLSDVAEKSSKLDHNFKTGDNFFKIYPNPTSSDININVTDKISKYEVCLYDLSGEIIKCFENTKKIQLNFLKDGFYFVILKDLDGNILSRKKVYKRNY